MLLTALSLHGLANLGDFLFALGVFQKIAFPFVVSHGNSFARLERLQLPSGILAKLLFFRCRLLFLARFFGTFLGILLPLAKLEFTISGCFLYGTRRRLA